jgi:riboflavin synthase
MFTGLVEACVPLGKLTPQGAGLRISLPRPSPSFDTRPGDSVAVSGCCLTVVSGRGTGGELVFDLSAETLARTWFARAAPGAQVNLERALQLGARLGGHLVSGHVDGLATLLGRRDTGDGGVELEVEVPADQARYLIEKGSVTLDGVSLTVVQPAGRRFRVALIPETLEHTSLGRARPGDVLHLEADMIGKWVLSRMPGP